MSTTLSLKDTLNDLAHELAITRRALERIPDDKLAWKPHERSMTLGGLGLHIANLVYWMETVVGREEYDLASGPSSLGEPGSRDEILQKFDGHVKEVLETASTIDDAALSQEWTLRHGDKVLMKQPRLNALRSACISHLAHHRGQLSVYLRLLEIPVPAIYGPSADES